MKLLNTEFLKINCPSGRICVRPDHRLKGLRPVTRRHRMPAMPREPSPEQRPLAWWYARLATMARQSCRRCDGATVPTLRTNDDGARAIVYYCWPCGWDARPVVYQDGDMIQEVAL